MRNRRQKGGEDYEQRKKAKDRHPAFAGDGWTTKNSDDCRGFAFDDCGFVSVSSLSGSL